MAVRALLIEGFHGNLKYIDNDISQVRKIFDSLNISTQIAPIGNAREVRNKIEDECAGSYSNDVIIIYYTGHGILEKNKLHFKIADSPNRFTNMLSINAVVESLTNSVYTKVILILDCCNAEAAEKAIVNEDLERFHLLYSSRTLQKSWELDEYQMSAFTKFMCDSLETLSRTSVANGRITLRNLDDEIRQKISIYNNEQHRNIPHPGSLGTRSDEIVLYTLYNGGETELISKVKDYRCNFLSCIEDCIKTCSGRFSWCDTLFRHDINMRTYTIPTVKIGDGSTLKLEKFFYEWVRSNNTYLALLANAGVGKTSACFHLASMIMKSNFQFDLLPVFVPLQLWDEIAKGKNVFEIIQIFSNGVFTTAEIQELTNLKKLLFLLDGFDEINTESTLSGIIANFKKLAPFLRFGCKTILTCRTHYFADENQISDVLQGKVVGTDFAALLLSDEYNFYIGELQEFSENEILEVIQLSVTSEDANKIWDDIKAIYDLRDLAKKAIILKMILKTLPELKKKSQTGKITASTLYRIYTYKLLKRELSERRYKMDISDLEDFIEYIASLMWEHQTLSINTQVFHKEIVSFRSKQSDIHLGLDQYIYSGRVSSFFIRDRNDNYAFSHKSFYEYYFARYCIQSIEDAECDFSGWKRKWFDKEVANFIADIIVAEHKAFTIIQLFSAANQVTHPTIIWNVLHILSLLDYDVVQKYLTDDTKKSLVDKAKRETNCVIIRQYCRIIAKFIDRTLSEQFIDKIIEIVRIDKNQNRENNDTYFNYYNGKDSACSAFIKHLQTPSPKYDAKLHIYLLGDIAGTEYLEPFVAATKTWSATEYQRLSVSVEQAIAAISKRDLTHINTQP